MLNKWMQAIVAQFPSFPDQAQKLISDFLSLHDGDVESEMNKELILNMWVSSYLFCRLQKLISI